MCRQAAIILTVVLALILMVTAVGCPASPEGKEVTVGNKNFAEQFIVGELMRQLLEDRGFTVELKSERSTEYLREGMVFGDIDICADYTGTGWMVHLDHVYKPGMDNNEIYRLVKEEDEGNGFIWLDPMWNNNTYALASWPEFAQKYGLRTLSDLAALYREEEGEIKTFVGLEFARRPDGLPALENHYDFEVARSFLISEPPTAYLLALKDRKVDVSMVFGTDAEVAKHGWHVYLDDKVFFPPYDLTPYIRKGVLDKYPEIAGVLNKLVATFPGGGGPFNTEIGPQCQKTWQELNGKVSIGEMEPEEVAREYLVEHGLIKD